jgi:hypothetical protein
VKKHFISHFNRGRVSSYIFTAGCEDVHKDTYLLGVLKGSYECASVVNSVMFLGCRIIMRGLVLVLEGSTAPSYTRDDHRNIRGSRFSRTIMKMGDTLS